MKIPAYQARFYRRWNSSKRLFACEASLKETDLLVLTDKQCDKEWLMRRIAYYRDCLEEYINYKDRRFLTSLKPIAVESGSPAIIRQMAEQSKKANVGPMAAVAGAVAQCVGRELLRRGCRDVVVENGGDIFLKLRRPLSVGLFAGQNRLLSSLAIGIDPEDTPLGICTSSATIGHSLSFGKADAVAIFAGNAALADAVATATANRVSGRADIARAIEFARSIKGVRAAVIVFRSTMATWGKIRFVPGRRSTST